MYLAKFLMTKRKRTTEGRQRQINEYKQQHTNELKQDEQPHTNEMKQEVKKYHKRDEEKN